MKKTYSVSEAARLLGYSTNSVYSFLKKGDIKSTRLGKGKFRIPQAEIDRLLAREPIETDVDQNVIAEPVVSEPLRLNVPRPGKSLSELGSDKPFRTVLLWFQERAGLPSLFDWFVALSSIVLGITLFIYNKQLDSLLVGRFALWFTPIKIALLCGGVGLILADMLRDETPMFKNFNNVFRYILAATFLGLAFIQLQSNDADGFLIDGLFALVILVEVMFGIISSTAYMFYLLGLMVEISLIVYLYPGNSGLSEISATVSKLTGGSTWIFGVLSILVVGLSVFGYFWNKMVLKIVLGIAGIDAFPEKKFTGKVTEVANIGEQIQNSNAKVYEVKIVIKEFDSILRPAMTTKNKILTNIIENVLFIPIEAIFNSDSVTFVYKKRGSSAGKQQVIVGQSNENEIIIRAGLQADDVVLLVPPDKSDKLTINLLPKETIDKYKEKPSGVKPHKPSGKDSGKGPNPPPVILKK